MANNGYDQNYEDDRKEHEETKKLPRRLAGVALAPAGALAGLALSPVPGMPNALESMKLGAKSTYHGISGDKAGLERDIADAQASRKRDANLERKPNKGENTNAAGDSYKKGGTVSSASKRADGIAVKGKTRGKIC
jgi:hypothetical protein